jgi:hypothetical protein
MSIAMLGHLGLAQETSAGVEQDPPIAFGEIASESIALESALLKPRRIGGIRGTRRVLPGPISGGGAFTFDATPEDLMGWVLKGILGAPVTTILAPGIYQHVFTPQSGFELPSFTVQVNAEAGTWNWLGSRFSSLEMSIAPDDLISTVVNLFAVTQKEATPAVPSFSGFDPWTAYDVYVDLNGVQNDAIENLSLTIDNGMEIVKTLNNQRYARRISSTTFASSGSFNLEFNEMDLLRRFWGNASATEPQNCIEANDLELSIVKSCPEGEIVPGSGVYQTLIITYPRIYYSSVTTNLESADSRIMQAVAFESAYSDSDGYELKITLINSESGYPNP